MRPPKVMVLYNVPTLPPDHPDADSEHDVLDTVNCIASIYEQAGLDVERFGFQYDLRALQDAIATRQPDVIFNLYEGTAEWPQSEALVAAALELTRVPFTGSPASAIMLARSKPLTKYVLAGAGLDTPRFREINAEVACDNDHGGNDLSKNDHGWNDLGWPVIVKPSLEDASVGIDQSSVVTNQDALRARVLALKRLYGPAVHFEEFIHGREFHVSILEQPDGLRTLPFSEIFFCETDGESPLWPIVSFHAKWHENTRDFKATPVKNPADVDEPLRQRVTLAAERAFRLLGCRDYARIDIRVNAEDRPYILEVNPNPCISPLAGVAEALASSGISFPEFALSLLRSALRRGPMPALADFALKVPPAEIKVPVQP